MQNKAIIQNTGTNKLVTMEHGTDISILHSNMSFKYIVFLQTGPSNDFHGSQDIHSLLFAFCYFKINKKLNQPSFGHLVHMFTIYTLLKCSLLKWY